MGKELEALDTLYYSCNVKKLEQAYKFLKEYLKSIDNANPSEALKCLEKLKGMEISSMPFSDEYGTQEVDLNDIRKVGSQLNTDFRKYTNTIKQALLKAQEEHKALEIIKKNFEFGLFEEDKYKVYIYSSDDDYSVVKRISEEEFNLLKEVLECQK